MKKIPVFLPILMITIFLSSCQAVGAIFKAGVWVGVIFVVLIVGVILWLVRRGSNKN